MNRPTKREAAAVGVLGVLCSLPSLLTMYELMDPIASAVFGLISLATVAAVGVKLWKFR